MVAVHRYTKVILTHTVEMIRLCLAESFRSFFVAVITDPRPGHDFGKQHQFNYDYSYWSLTVMRAILSLLLVKQNFEIAGTFADLSSVLKSAPQIWNTLPSDLKHININREREEFKSGLKTWLFVQACL